ncbi:phosphoribosylanthranilate isomerase [Rummeliibacillus sp. SL167]|uniref:phosphoribosylanthranilate isomerase n=1 Tax=Rummeliibacillus sp. SL167 TaxID=2579792 RepID=UPI0011B58D01|nr:phosphoribosylanthranilate isomerase [Rummeliibacillus sp. SL167]
MTKVKICGLMNKEHVNTAVQSGADAIGFVFAKSKRQVSIEKAAQLATAVPASVLKIGVFVDAEPAFIVKAYQEVPLDYVQFHGHETNEEIQRLGLPSIKACSVKCEEDIERASTYDTDYLLFDAPGIEFAGGSGKTFNWNLLFNHPALKERKIILAGGLNASNVKQAIDIANPYMLDVSSGVEKNGQKDHVLIKRFIEAAKGECLVNGKRTK